MAEAATLAPRPPSALASNEALVSLRHQFPGLFTNDGAPWHYLDTAATAQKPRAVIDAMARALGEDYATVHRGVYSRSAQMTLGYEAARRRVARFIGGKEDEIVFVRGATEGINLVAQSWGGANLGPGDRIVLSQLEHHSNIVPWQLVAERAGAAIDVCPITETGEIDCDALEAMLTPAHKLVALAHVSQRLRLGARCEARRQGRAFGGCAPIARRLPVRPENGAQHGRARLRTSSSFQATSSTARPVSACYGHARSCWRQCPHGRAGGAMIDQVSFERTTYAPAPQRFEAGTPMIAEAIALAVAIDWLEDVAGDDGMAALYAHENALVHRLRSELGRNRRRPPVRPRRQRPGSSASSSTGVHPHDLGTILDEEDVAIPRRASLRPTADGASRHSRHRARQLRRSIRTKSDVAALLRGIERTVRIFG